MTRIYLGFGSNVGDRKSYLMRACKAIAHHYPEVARSSIYENPAMLPEGAPPSWDYPFLNMVACFEAHEPPERVMQVIKETETALGRNRLGHWSPREIDIDVLLYGDLVRYTQQLNIPHPGLLERDFVLLPLAEIAPDLTYPAPGAFAGLTMQQIASHKAYSHHHCTPISA